MSRTESVEIVDTDGLTFNARIEQAPTYKSDSQLLLQLDDGSQMLVPGEKLVLRGDGKYHLKMSLREYTQQASTSQQYDASTVISLAEETLQVDTRTVERGRVQVSKRVLEREETIDVPLTQEEVEVERVSINRVVDEPVPVHDEGDTTVIPLYEEVLVVTKQLMLVEEVRITKRRSEHRESQKIVLRREEVTVDHTEAEPENKGGAEVVP